MRVEPDLGGDFGKSGLGTISAALEHLWSKTPPRRRDFRELTGIKAIESSGVMERAMGIEPTSEAWEAALRAIPAARCGLLHVHRWSICAAESVQLPSNSIAGISGQRSRKRHQMRHL
jgi:hypothetical protein